MPEVNGQYSMNPQLAQAAATQKQTERQSAGKVSAQDAKYVDVAGSCASCSKFQGDGQPCAVVADPVSSGGWCSLYEAGTPSMGGDANAGAPAGDTATQSLSASPQMS